MLLREMLFDIDNMDVSILATDISDSAIQRASRGFYPDHEIQRGMKTNMLEKYFQRVDKGWQVKDQLRALVAYRRFNLHDPLTGMGPFDIVFCRNVAIYFDPEDRGKLFLNIANVLAPDGYLFVGSSESLTDVDPKFVPQHHCRGIFYQPNLVVSSGVC